MIKEIHLRPFPKQHLAYTYLFDDTTKYLLYGGGAGGGKSWLGSEYLILMCLQYPGVKYFIAREKLKTLKSSTLLTFFNVARKHGLVRDVDFIYREQQSYIQFVNGSRIDLIEVKYNPSDPMFEDLGSSEYTGGWIEEAGEIVANAFDVLKSRIGRQLNSKYNIKAKLLITCNPKKNWLYSLFYKPYIDGSLEEGYAFVPALVTDNTEIDTGYIKNLMEIRDNITRQRLLEGLWDYEQVNGSLYTYDGISDLWTNSLSEEHKAGRYITCDVARNGKDKTVVYVWRGFDLFLIEAYTKQDTKVTATKIAELSRLHNVPRSHILIDEDGIGGGVLDNLPGAHGFVNNSSPLENEFPHYEYLAQQNFANLKTQVAYIMSIITDKRQACISFKMNDKYKNEIEQELQATLIERPDNDTTKMRLVPKDVVKQQIGRSPDWADAFNMRAWFTLRRNFKGVTLAQQLAIQAEEYMESKKSNNNLYDIFPV